MTWRVRARDSAVMLLVLPMRLVAAQASENGPAAFDPELRARIDRIATASLAPNDAAGSVVAIVRGDRVVHLRGYGVADRASARAVDPERTTFGLSSIAKVFTAIAVLRLAEQGRLSLDDPVTRHVRLPALESALGREVRVSHLLTHSGGFDERTIGIAARTPATVVPLATYLAREMPALVRRPGTTASYSNHGFALAGLIVERVAGEPFADHLRRQVLDPLGMRGSGFEQPLPDELERARAVPHRGSGTAAVPRIYFNDAPASALYATGADMGRFMTAFLATDTGSALGSVLRSTAPMRERRFANHPALNGLTFGFRERRDGAVRTLEQGGDWDDYSSDLLLAPALRVGLFVALSGPGGDVVADSIWRTLLAEYDRTDAGAAAPSPPPLDLDGRADPAGVYRLNRYSRHTLAKMGVLTGAIREVTVVQDGGRLSMLAQALTPVAPDVYHRSGGGSPVAFRYDASGRATHLFIDASPYVAFERVPRHARRGLHLFLFGVTFLVLLGTLWRAVVAWPLDPARGDRLMAAWRWAMIAAAGGAAWLGVGLVAVMLTIDLGELQYGLPLTLRLVLTGGLVATVAGGLAVALGVAVFARRSGAGLSRMARLAASMAAGAFAFLVVYWRLLPTAA